MIPIFDPIYKQKKQVEKYKWALYQESIIPLQCRFFFIMYQKMISKETSWAGPRRSWSEQTSNRYHDNELCIDNNSVEFFSSAKTSNENI